MPRRSGGVARDVVHGRVRLEAPETTRKSVMRPANGSATVFQTNAASGPGRRGRASTCSSRRSWRRRLHRPLGRRRHVARRSRRAAAGCRCSPSPTCRRAGRPAPAMPRLRPGDELVLRQRARVEELLHERIVCLGDHLDERLARGWAAPCRSAGSSLPGLPLPSAEGPGFHRDEVSTVNRHDRAAEDAAERLERAIEVGPLAVDPVQHDQRGSSCSCAIFQTFGLDLDAGDRVHDDERASATRMAARASPGSSPSRACRSS